MSSVVAGVDLCGVSALLLGVEKNVSLFGDR
jgi:hypothetical protein